ncbi:hypothetical protein AeRB84_007724 [Aphanomyces euteiches]|nr:hypothetical protein AeRB84_007724 [Aphanomyces euteiches]
MFSFLRRASPGTTKPLSDPDPVRALAAKAITTDERGEYNAAVELYTELIDKLLTKLKDTPDGEKHRDLRKEIERYMSRAEYIKSLSKEPKTTNAKVEISATFPTAQATKSNERKTSALIARNDPICHLILDEVLDKSPGVTWDDIAGLDEAKQMLQEAVVLPTLRLCAPPKGALLFGPPGTGKTMLAKAVATESNATFFSITASSLTSKWVGEGEKLVRALFEMAKELQPSVIFVDEIDSLLSSRSSGEHDASRRIKNEFFTQLDGATSTSHERILVLGATNLPQELDEAIIRRLEKRIYVSLPDVAARRYLIEHLLKLHQHTLTKADINVIAEATSKFSGSDVRNLCKEAAMGPLRSLGARLKDAAAEDIRPISKSDFDNALKHVQPSVSNQTLRQLEEWNDHYGFRHH